MSNYDTLKARLRTTPFLCIDADTKTVKLLGKLDAIKRAEEIASSPFPSVTIMHAARALENFANLVDRIDREFQLPEVCVIAGLPFARGHLWVTQRLWSHPFEGATDKAKERNGCSTGPMRLSLV